MVTSSGGLEGEYLMACITGIYYAHSSSLVSQDQGIIPRLLFKKTIIDLKSISPAIVLLCDDDGVIYLK